MAFWKKKLNRKQIEGMDEKNLESAVRKERKARNPIKRWRLLVAALTTFFCGARCFIWSE